MYGVYNCINISWAGRFLEVLHLLKSKLLLLEVLCFSWDTISQLVKVVCVVYWGSSVSPVYMFDTGHPALTWTIGPGKWTLYSLAQSKTIQRYTVIGGGTKRDIEGDILSTKFIQNFTWISGKFFFNKFMQTAVIILFIIMKRKYIFSQNNDTKFKKRGKRFASDNPYNPYWLL